MRRLLVSLPIALLLTSAAVFALPFLAGTDPAATVLRARYDESDLDPETLSALRTELGLDRPVIVQFGTFLGDVVRGDLGVSYVSGQPVAGEALRAVRVSGSLVALAMAAALAVAVPAGLIAAARAGGRLDRTIAALCAVGSAVPEHVLGPMVVITTAVWTGLLPSGGWDRPIDLVAPTAVLGLHPTVVLLQVLRAETVGVLASPFIRTARAMGARPHRILLHHAFAVSRKGLLALGSTMCAGLLAGSVVVETVFSVPGIGRHLVLAARSGDLPALQAGLLVVVATALVLGAVVDTAAARTDRRIEPSRT